MNIYITNLYLSFQNSIIRITLEFTWFKPSVNYTTYDLKDMLLNTVQLRQTWKKTHSNKLLYVSNSSSQWDYNKTH